MFPGKGLVVAVGVDDVAALDAGAGGAEGGVLEVEALSVFFTDDFDGPAGFAEGELGAGAGGEEGGFDAPLDEEVLESIEGKAFADAAEVEDAAGGLAGDGGAVGVDDEASFDGRWRAFVLLFSMLNGAAEGDVEEAAGFDVVVEGEEQAGVGFLGDIEGFAGLHEVDAGDVAVFDVAAEFSFEAVEFFKGEMREVGGVVSLQMTDPEGEGGLHRFVFEEMGWWEGGHGMR